MTVRYAAKLATNTSLGCFTKLLFRWRGSVYKLVWAEYLVFISLYYVISIMYRFLLKEEQQLLFEKIVNYCEKSGGSIEMSFVLGFFVTSVVSKWWTLYCTIPWPDPVALLINANIIGWDDRTKLLKQKIMRYCSLNLALTFQIISPPIKRRYPTLHHLVKEGLLMKEEKLVLEKVDKFSSHPCHWLPISWATQLVIDSAKEGKIVSEFACQRIIDELDKFRHGCALLLEYEYCTVPLVYIQVVTISVYSYFLSCLLGSQWLVRDSNFQNLDLYFPFFTTLQFIFYMGWLKVAESLINPFGYDDDDFELDEIMDRHHQVTQMMVSGVDEKGMFSSGAHNDSQQSAIFFNERVNGCHCGNKMTNRKWNLTSAISLDAGNDSDNYSRKRASSSSLPPPRFSQVCLNRRGHGESKISGTNIAKEENSTVKAPENGNQKPENGNQSSELSASYVMTVDSNSHNYELTEDQSVTTDNNYSKL